MEVEHTMNGPTATRKRTWLEHHRLGTLLVVAAAMAVIAGCGTSTHKIVSAPKPNPLPGADGSAYAFNFDSAATFTEHQWKTNNGTGLQLNCPESGTIQAKKGDTFTCTYVTGQGDFGILILTVGANQNFTYAPDKSHLWFGGVLNDIRNQYQQKHGATLAMACPHYQSIISFTGPQDFICSFTDSSNRIGTVSIAVTALPDVYKWREAPAGQGNSTPGGPVVGGPTPSGDCSPIPGGPHSCP